MMAFPGTINIWYNMIRHKKQQDKPAQLGGCQTRWKSKHPCSCQWIFWDLLTTSPVISSISSTLFEHRNSDLPFKKWQQRWTFNRSETSNIKHHPIITWFIHTFIVGGGIKYCKPGDQLLRLRGVFEAAAQVEERAPPGNLTNRSMKHPSFIFHIRFQYHLVHQTLIMKCLWYFHIFPRQISMADIISSHFTWKLALCWHWRSQA